MGKLLYGDLTKTINDAFYAVCREFQWRRRGLDEAVLSAALQQALRQRGVRVQTEVPLTYRSQGQVVGTGKVDLLCNDVVAVELKVLDRLTPAHHEQLQSYLADGGWAVGLLLNFGGKQPKVVRLYERQHDPTLPENQR